MPQTLDDYYAEIEGMITEGEALTAARDPASTRRLKRRVADSMLLVASYQLFVHRHVFAPLLDDGDPALRSRVNEVKVECIALTEDLRFNVKDFLADETPLDWDVVTAKMGWYNGRLRKHIAEVRQLMSPNLSDAEHASLIARRVGTVGAQAA
ncbi:MAG: hypothetical protein E7773_03060 [Sphingomonas sp.]|uniref:hypothetical protein n=1 Tax=Sphingomonas sp. TaxID=28214 RepID=UPI00121A2D1B|nr:hypothetical protein [Sphingomonas sp.]THD37970.1 MAG: hypothetical protein E7773_03060 [Sphingomonas sp.]